MSATRVNLSNYEFKGLYIDTNDAQMEHTAESRPVKQHAGSPDEEGKK